MHNPEMDNMEKYPTDAWRVGKGGGEVRGGEMGQGMVQLGLTDALWVHV